MRRRALDFSSPRSIRSQRESTLDRRTTRRGLSPFARRPHRTPPPLRSAASFPIPSHRGMSPRVERIARLGVLVLGGPWSRALFSQHRQMGTRCFASTRGPCGAGGRAFRGLTRSATEWSAARRKPLRAAALHLSAAISADVKARKLPTSQRRKFPSAEIFEARATLREQSGSTLGRRVSAPARPRLLQRNEECPHYRQSLRLA